LILDGCEIIRIEAGASANVSHMPYLE